jgi:hypothetical protein
MLTLIGLIFFMWLSHFAHAWWRRRPARERLRRMRARLGQKFK